MNCSDCSICQLDGMSLCSNCPKCSKPGQFDFTFNFVKNGIIEIKSKMSLIIRSDFLNRIERYKLTLDEDIKFLEQLFKDEILTESNHYTSNIRKSKINNYYITKRMLEDENSNMDYILIIRKKIENTKGVTLKIFNQEITISNQRLNNMQTYSNITLQNILNMDNIPETTINNMKQESSHNNSQNNDIYKSSSIRSNFEVYTTHISKDDITLSLKDTIDKNLYIILIQKLPPHLEDINVLTAKEIVQSVSQTTLSVLIGKDIVYE